MNAKREDVLGSGIEDFPQVFTEQEVLTRIKDALNGKDSVIELKFQAGQIEFYFDRKIVPTTFDDGSLGVTLILQDITECRRAEQERDGLLRNYSERIKELACLYKMSKLVKKHNSLEGILKGTVKILPSAWRYSDIACAKIVFESQKYKTRSFKESRWKQQSNIEVNGKREGTVEVHCSEEKRRFDKNPFLKEEKALTEAVAERLGKIIQRKKAEEALRKAA
ncbi:MAG: PAS domain-containing protein [Candidatus Bathyarchaeota archaeon]|nr:PAS domain-containing protein [Candidatus Bathyarchaeota archaeon]